MLKRGFTLWYVLKHLACADTVLLCCCVGPKTRATAALSQLTRDQAVFQKSLRHMLSYVPHLLNRVKNEFIAEYRGTKCCFDYWSHGCATGVLEDNLTLTVRKTTDKSFLFDIRRLTTLLHISKLFRNGRNRRPKT